LWGRANLLCHPERGRCVPSEARGRPCSTRHCEEAEGLVRPVIARRPKALFDPSLRGGRRPCSTRHCEGAEGRRRISFFKLTGYQLAKSSLADIAEGLGSPKAAILSRICRTKIRPFSKKSISGRATRGAGVGGQFRHKGGAISEPDSNGAAVFHRPEKAKSPGRVPLKLPRLIG
jgi:hypothetical protein